MISRPFLTELDTRAAVKGSRDPLGIQQIWTQLGRYVVGNLTTVSDSVRDFTVLLFGYYYANLLAEELGKDSILSTFLKWEQLAGYARAHCNNDTAFRGTERVQKNIAAGHLISISSDRAHQILSNQKVYGLWGLYTVSARSSGLVKDNPPRLADVAIELIENFYLPRAEKVYPTFSRDIIKILKAPISRINIRDSEAPLLKIIGEQLLSKRLLKKELNFYREHLLMGGPLETEHTSGRQPQLVELLEETLNRETFTWSVAEVSSLVENARNRGESWASTAECLDMIRVAETVLGPASLVFSYLLGLNGKAVRDVVDRMRDLWGSSLELIDSDQFKHMCSFLKATDESTKALWIKISDTACNGEYQKLIELLIEQNTSVMKHRGSMGSWIVIEDGTFKVHFREEGAGLVPKEQLWKIWRFPYFLDSLRTMAKSLRP